MEILQKLTDLCWSTQTTKPTLTQAPDVTQTLIGEIMRYFQFSTKYTAIAEWGLRVFFALLVFLLVAFLARRSRIQRLVKWIDDRVGLIELKEVDQRFFSFLLSTTTWIFGLLVMLSILKLNALLATLGLSAGAIATVTAVANKELIGHFFSGIALQARGQIQKGESIEVLGVAGTLQSIGMTACEIEDFDGVVHFIPNTKMLSEKLTNYSAAKHRRVSFSFVCETTNTSLETIEEVGQAFLSELPHKKIGKEGGLSFGMLSEKGLEVHITAYFERDGWSAGRSQGYRLLQQKLSDAGITFGLPQQIVRLYTGETEGKS